VVLFFISYNYVNEFKLRVDAAKGLWIDKNFGIKNTNNSSFVLYNNLNIAFESLSNHPFLGTGLGSHESAFKKYSLTKTMLNYNFEFNIKDGNSLFVRLCTETGLIGLIFVFYILIYGFIYKTNMSDSEENTHELISHSLFIILVLTLLRQGNYMLNGLPLIFFVYYYNGKNYKTLNE
jgi:O-antigen ligase